MLIRDAILRLAFLVTIFALTTAAGAQTDKAAATVRAMIDAMGGKSFLDVREIQATGKYFAFRADRATGSDAFLDYIQFPDKERTEMGTYRIKPTQINNGDAGWTVNDKKIESQSASEIKEFKAAFNTGFQYVARFVLAKPGLNMLLSDSELVNFRRNDVIEFRDSGNFFRLYIDQQSHLPTKLDVRRPGEPFFREEQFANWHTFQGIQTPLFIINLKDGEKTMEVRFDNVRYNSGLADGLFSPPDSTTSR